MSANQSPKSDETKFIKRGLLFGVIVLLIAGNMFYDDVYNDGVSTSLKSKIKRFTSKSKTPVLPAEQISTSSNIEEQGIESDTSNYSK